MIGKTGCILCALFAAAASADDKTLLPDDLFRAKGVQLRPVDLEMSRQEYRQARRSNQRRVAESVRFSIYSLGSTPEGGAMVGSAIGAALNGAELALNPNNTMALQVRDPADGDRSVRLRFRLDWR